METQDLFSSNDLAFICHSIAVTKGFWNTPPTDLAAFTWRQLCHIVDEFVEFMNEPAYENSKEELADIAIVIFDLLGAHGMEVTSDLFSATEGQELYDDNDFDTYVVGVIGRISNQFRKTGQLNYEQLLSIVSFICYELQTFFNTDLLTEVTAKCKKNIERKQGYGVFVQPIIVNLMGDEMHSNWTDKNLWVLLRSENDPETGVHYNTQVWGVFESMEKAEGYPFELSMAHVNWNRRTDGSVNYGDSDDRTVFWRIVRSTLHI